MIGAPFTVHIRVFASDRGFSWRVEIWKGNVDIRNDPPTQHLDSKIAFPTAAAAWNAASARADRMIKRGTVN